MTHSGLCSFILPALLLTSPIWFVAPRLVGAHADPGLSKLAFQDSAQRGSAAPTCGKPRAFRLTPHASFSFAQAGRPSLPACAKEVFQDAGSSERRSLSASQAAEPQVVVHWFERNLDKLDADPPLRSEQALKAGAAPKKRTASWLASPGTEFRLAYRRTSTRVPLSAPSRQARIAVRGAAWSAPEGAEEVAA
jgi:hypothetical protein